MKGAHANRGRNQGWNYSTADNSGPFRNLRDKAVSRGRRGALCDRGAAAVSFRDGHGEDQYGGGDHRLVLLFLAALGLVLANQPGQAPVAAAAGVL